MLYPQSSHKQKEPDYNMLQLELNNTNINIKNAVIYYTQFLSDQPNSEKSYERSLDHLEKKCGLVLTDNQRRAILQSIVENHNLSKEEKRFCRDIFNKAGRKKEKGSKNPLIRHLKNPTT
ncbi:hypothetical protein GW750_05005 [bacterium]|nr:hypothetical protein [bacterium]